MTISAYKASPPGPRYLFDIMLHCFPPYSCSPATWSPYWSLQVQPGGSCLRDFTLTTPLSSNALSLVILTAHIFILLVFSQISFCWDLPNYPSMFLIPSPEFSTAFSCFIFLQPLLSNNILYVLLIYFIISHLTGLCVRRQQGFLLTAISWVSWTVSSTK